jgi:hypothetical protein
MPVDASLSGRRLLHVQLWAITLILVACTANYLVTSVAGEVAIRAHLPLRILDVAEEHSIPTWFSAASLLVSSCLLGMVFLRARAQKESVRPFWLALSLLFLGLSLDEGAGLHETVGQLQDLTGMTVRPLATHSWLLPGAAFTLLVLLVFVPFLRSIHRPTAVRFLGAGAVFVTGALGMELAGAVMLYSGVASEAALVYDLRRVVEEALEMYGIALFNYALCRELARTSTVLALRLE